MHSRRNVQAQARARYRALEWARVWRPEMTSYLGQILQQSFNDIKRGRPYSNELPDRDGCPSSNDYPLLGTIGLPPYPPL